MAGSIRTTPATEEYREGFERTFKSGQSEAPPEVPEPPGPDHACEWCGKVMAAGKECACTAMKPATRRGFTRSR